ncbi:MAG: hypothetical protein NTW94_02730 [Legionellales bacterium]|nr:hypothetical protein [Legionellales bacterium]
MRDLTEPISQIQLILAESQSSLQNLLQDAPNLEADPYEGIERLELLLQYRLDTEDALMKLRQMDQALLQLLGIEPMAASSTNIERMSYALGHDDLRYLLQALQPLVRALSLAALRTKRLQSAPSRLQKLQASKPSLHKKFQTSLTTIVQRHQQFLTLLQQLQHNIDLWTRLGASMGPVLDTIAALRGPISQFYQAELNGLELSFNLYQNLHQATPMAPTLSHVLQEANQAFLHPTPVMTPPMNLFKPALIATEEQLELRASAKRLGHFFSYR